MVLFRYICRFLGSFFTRNASELSYWSLKTSALSWQGTSLPLPTEEKLRLRETTYPESLSGAPRVETRFYLHLASSPVSFLRYHVKTIDTSNEVILMNTSSHNVVGEKQCPPQLPG